MVGMELAGHRALRWATQAGNWLAAVLERRALAVLVAWLLVAVLGLHPAAQVVVALPTSRLCAASKKTKGRKAVAEPIIQTAAAGVSLVTLATAIAGPLAGPYVVIAMGGVSGGLWALSSADSQTRIQGAMLMLRCVLTAVLLTALIAQVLGARFGIQVTELYGIVSLVIGMLGNRWQDIIDAVRDKLRMLITRAPEDGGKP